MMRCWPAMPDNIQNGSRAFQTLEGQTGEILRRFRSSLPAFLLLFASPLAAQVPAYERRELTIPVRDGTKLFAVALIPQEMKQPLPIILIRTPFGAATEFRNAQLPAMYKELAQD